MCSVIMYRSNLEYKKENFGQYINYNPKDEMYSKAQVGPGPISRQVDTGAAHQSNSPEPQLSPTTTSTQEDEISKSLKMFAMLTAYKSETSQTQKPVDVIMQDFACNGYICDELNRYHQHQYNCAAAQHMQQHHINLKFHDTNGTSTNNIWKMMPTNNSHAAVPSTAAGNTVNNINASRKPPQKRFNGVKTEKQVPPLKHCVFCENNSEPEAVVRSHAVRDALGRVLCPKLRIYICPICKASGDQAHTVKYCPQKPIITMEDSIKAESFRLAKGTFYKQKMNF